MNTVESGWRGVEKPLEGVGVDDGNREDMRLVFYLGAMHVFKVMENLMRAGASKEAAVAVMQGMREELIAFGYDDGNDSGRGAK